MTLKEFKKYLNASVTFHVTERGTNKKLFTFASCFTSLGEYADKKIYLIFQSPDGCLDVCVY